MAISPFKIQHMTPSIAAVYAMISSTLVLYVIQIKEPVQISASPIDGARV